MEREKVYLKLLGKKLIGFKKQSNGEIIGTGILNPIIKKMGFFTMLLIQAQFYRKYKNLGTWRGKRVANTFAPPIGSRAMFRLLNASIKGRIFRYTFPVAMTFAVTYQCQCKCIHCSAGMHIKRNIPELSTLEAKYVIDQSQNLGVSIIAFTGGEPLLRDDIFELISYVDKKKAVPILFTNGLLLSDEVAEKLAKAGLYSIFVSIDSPDQKEHDDLRGRSNLFEVAIDGIKKMKSKGVFVGISSYATRSATERGMYKRLYSLAREIGVDNVILFDGVPTGKMLKDTSEMLTAEQREEIREYSAKIFNQQLIPPLSSQSWQNSIEGYLGGIGCLAANIQYYVSAYGEVTPCDFSPLSFGNIKKTLLGDIWKKMVKHPAYNHRSTFCRMQNPDFRAIYIDSIPDNSPLPYSIEKFPYVDYRAKG
ncbi:MAG: radical SAM protein [Promethearchaeota archaeon]|jgi:MoaA/NifB/PqqE/SkfB family radical SAM enzyme